MNFVYDVSHPSENIHYAVGGENRTKALINYMNEIGENECEFIHYRASKAKDYGGNSIMTEKSGFVDMEELMPKGYKTWWTCPECGCDGDEVLCFDYLPIDKYRCKECGYEADIPFAE